MGTLVVMIVLRKPILSFVTLNVRDEMPMMSCLDHE